MSSDTKDAPVCGTCGLPITPTDFEGHATGWLHAAVDLKKSDEAGCIGRASPLVAKPTEGA